MPNPASNCFIVLCRDKVYPESRQGSGGRYPPLTDMPARRVLNELRRHDPHFNEPTAGEGSLGRA